MAKTPFDIVRPGDVRSLPTPLGREAKPGLESSCRHAPGDKSAQPPSEDDRPYLFSLTGSRGRCNRQLPQNCPVENFPGGFSSLLLPPYEGGPSLLPPLTKGGPLFSPLTKGGPLFSPPYEGGVGGVMREAAPFPPLWTLSHGAYWRGQFLIAFALRTTAPFSLNPLRPSWNGLHCAPTHTPQPAIRGCSRAILQKMDCIALRHTHNRPRTAHPGSPHDRVGEKVTSVRATDSVPSRPVSFISPRTSAVKRVQRMQCIQRLQ